MNVRAHLRDRLLKDATTAALVGARIYRARAPQNAPLPHVFITTQDTEELRTLRGAEDYSETMFQINCIGSTDAEACDLGDAVKEALKNYKGFNGGNTIFGITVENDMDDDWSEATGLYRRILEVNVSHTN